MLQAGTLKSIKFSSQLHFGSKIVRHFVLVWNFFLYFLSHVLPPHSDNWHWPWEIQIHSSLRSSGQLYFLFHCVLFRQTKLCKHNFISQNQHELRIKNPIKRYVKWNAFYFITKKLSERKASRINSIVMMCPSMTIDLWSIYSSSELIISIIGMDQVLLFKGPFQMWAPIKKNGLMRAAYLRERANMPCVNFNNGFQWEEKSSRTFFIFLFKWIKKLFAGVDMLSVEMKMATG